MSKLKTFDQKQTNWLGLWWHSEYGGFYSSVISLSELRKFKGNVRLCVRKNKYYNKGENNRPNYCFSFKEADADVFHVLQVLDYDGKLYTRNDLETVMRLSWQYAQDGFPYGHFSVDDFIEQEE